MDNYHRMRGYCTYIVFLADISGNVKPAMYSPYVFKLKVHDKALPCFSPKQPVYMVVP